MSILTSGGLAPTHSINGPVYYITFVDSFSRFTWNYMLQRKYEALSIFVKFKATAELQLATKIKAIQSNWGGEYRDFSNLLQHHGITQQ